MADFYKKLLPVIVLYGQDLASSLTLCSLNTELENLGIRMPVFIFDNSPVQQYMTNFFVWKNFDIHYEHAPDNPGLGKAYNFGAEKAQNMGMKWLLLLDQDTCFVQGFLTKYQQAIVSSKHLSLFAPVLKLKDGTLFSPFIPKHKRGYPAGTISLGEHSLKKYFPVNSGIVVSLDLFLKAGGYNEKVKVDFSDMQFMERVMRIDNRFCVTEVIGVQDFSAFEVSIEKQQRRFCIYLADAIACEKIGWSDRIGFFYAVTRHMLALVLKRKSLSFLVLYIRKYLLV